MKQVPDSLLAFQHMFPDDDACAAWLIEMRWPDGFVCPACGHEKGWALRRKAHTFECAGCRRQTSVTAGTILHASKLPLTVWFWAAYLMATHSNGISALQLQKQLGIGSYRSLGCSPTSCAPAWSTPSATRCRAWWKSTRPAFHSGPKTILPPAAATTARCSSSAELGDGNIPGRLRLAEISSYGAIPTPSRKPTAGPARRSPQCPCRRRRSPRRLPRAAKTRHAAFRSLFRLATNAEPLTYSMLIEPEPCA